MHKLLLIGALGVGLFAHWFLWMYWSFKGPKRLTSKEKVSAMVYAGIFVIGSIAILCGWSH